MSTIFDDSHLVEIGEEYERFVGAYYEKVLKCMVIFQGRILGKQDGGIDLIAVSKDNTYLVQCKNYLPSKLIHENVINQLSGSAKVFASKFPSAKNIVPVLACTCAVDESALYSATVNGVEIKRLDYQKKTVEKRLVLFNSKFSTEGYEPISAGLNMLPDYDVRLKAVLDVVQGQPAVPEAASVPDDPWAEDPPVQVFKDPECVDNDCSEPIRSNLMRGDSDGKYFIRSETPMRFHHFLRFIIFPLSSLYLIADILNVLDMIDYQMNLVSIGLLAFDIVPLALGIAFFVGSFKYAKYAYICALLWYWGDLAGLIVLNLINSAMGYGFQDTFATLFTKLVSSIVVTIYYHKRKALFYPELIPDAVADYFSAQASNEESSASEPEAQKPTKHRGSISTWIVSILIVGLIIFGIVVSVHPTPALKPSPTATTKATATVKPTANPTATPQSLPKPSNGYYKGFWYTTTSKQHWDGQLNVNTPDDGMYYCLIFVDADNPSNKCFSVFVWPGSEISIDVPTVDNLLLYTVCGKEWYGYEEYFGKNSIWSTSDDIFNFDTYIHTLTFKKIEGGNWETEDINSSQVPFLD